MLPVLSADEMRSCDATAVRRFGIPSLLLMENAGKGVAEKCLEYYGPLFRTLVAVFCGKGNNGGDGLVAARHLANTGAVVTVILFDSPAAFKGDAKKNLEIAARIQRKGSGNLNIVRYKPRLLTTLNPDLIIDAMYGTGFSGSMPKAQSEVALWMNKQRRPVVAVDIPSGINGTNGTKGAVAVKASQTFTMGALKRGILCSDGREHAGKIVIIDIGIPSDVFRQVKDRTVLVEELDLSSVAPRRTQSANKYTVGKVFVLAGSRGFTGAAALAATAVLRSGAGAVILGTPESVYPILAKKLSESIVVPLPSTASGSLSRGGAGAILERMAWSDVTIMGPGLSREPETQTLVQELVAKAGGKLLLDADALNAVSESDALRRSKARMILTPHTGEFSRLTGMSSKDIEQERIDAARNFSKKKRVTLVLKGAPTVTAAADGSVFLNSTANPGMATVGSGDVLSGIIGGLWAQGMTSEGAAWGGAFVHGLAGDLAAEKLGERSLVAGDLIDYLPRALRSAGEDD